jgi:hypothetical protein
LGAFVAIQQHRDFNKEAREFVYRLLDELPAEYDDPSENGLPSRIFWLITEIDNGGLWQYFTNIGEVATRTVQELQKIGASETAGILALACELFPGGVPPADPKERETLVRDLSLKQLDTLRALDDRFYSRREDLYLLVMDYWQSHHRQEA